MPQIVLIMCGMHLISLPHFTYCICTYICVFTLYVFSSRQIGDTLILKSGSDFRDFSQISVNFSNSRPTFNVERHTITSEIPPNPEVALIVEQYCADMQERMKEQIGRLAFVRTVHTYIQDMYRQHHTCKVP